MHIVIDFNGFFTAEKDFVIKEYSFYIISLRGEIKYNSFEVDISERKQLSIKTKKNYDNYYKKYGIKWTTGTLGRRKMKITLKKYFAKAMNIFVADNKRKEKLINYLNYDADKNKKVYKFICLRELGYEMNFKNSTTCHYHESPSSNNCANDNVLDMIKFVKDEKLYSSTRLKHIYSIVDFNYYEHINRTVIKELSITRISIDGDITSRSLLVRKPEKSHIEPDTYNKYYKKYGIKWEAGNEFPGYLIKNLYYDLKRALRTYVKNDIQKNILLDLSNENIEKKIICLDVLGYDVGNTELGFTVCEWHDNKMANNCADDNVRFMTDWLHRKKLLKLEISGNLKVNKVERNFKTPSVVVHKGSVYQDIKDIKARYYQAHGSREFSSVGNAVTASTSAGRKRKFDDLEVTPTAAQYYDAFASKLSTIQAIQANRHQEFEDDDDDDNVFDMASELGIEIKDDNAGVINETVAPNIPRYYQAHRPSDFPINQAEEQTNYDDESAIDIALELESQAGKHVPQNLADLNLESLSKYSIDNIHNYSFSSNEFDDLLNDENDNHQSKVDVNQLNDQAGEKLLSGSVFNNPNNLFDDDDIDFKDIMNIDASLHSEVMSDDRRENNDDQEDEIFDEKLLDTYIVNNPNNISFNEDEFNDISVETNYNL